MKLVLCALLFLLYFQNSDADSIGVPNPLKVIEKTATTVGKAADSVVKNIASDARNITESVTKVVANETEHIVENLSDIEKKGAKIVGQIENNTINAVDSVVGGAANEIKNIGEDVKAVDREVEKGAAKMLSKIQKGVFHVEKGVVNGIGEVVGTPVDLKEVTFHLVTSKNVEHPYEVNFYNPLDVSKTDANIYFLIHGFQSSMNVSWYTDVSKALIRNQLKAHVVQINWSKPASDPYPLAAFDTESVGNFVGIFINRLVADFKVKTEKILVVGHSLGGQIAGWAAKKFSEISGFKLPRIVALDPAGPLFVLRPDSRRLNKNDADIVMVMHTDGDKFGFPSPCGTIDFFPNGGNSQPGCWQVDLAKPSTLATPITCDHSRAEAFFTEAVNHTGSFPARKCGSYFDFLNNKCENDIVVCMGDLETSENGTFYLKTNDSAPFSRPLPEFENKTSEVKNTTEHSKT